MQVSQILLVAMAMVMLTSLTVEGALSFHSDPCPEGMGEGGSWFPDNHPCMECSCFGPSYTCATCGVSMGRDGCTLRAANPTGNYPDCCEMVEVCP